MSRKLKRNPAVVWREEPGSDSAAGDHPCATLVHLGSLFQINRVGTEIWKRCDGTRTEGEMARELLEIFEAPESEIVADVAAFATELLRRGWLEVEP